MNRWRLRFVSNKRTSIKKNWAHKIGCLQESSTRFNWDFKNVYNLEVHLKRPLSGTLSSNFRMTYIIIVTLYSTA